MTTHNLLLTYTYNNLSPYAITINKHLCVMTLNMYMKAFHTPETLDGLLDTQLGIQSSDALIEAILTYPEDVEKDKDVTVIFAME